MYLAVKCRCSYADCPDWHVAPVADIQGVSLTKSQAHFVAAVLNALETSELTEPPAKTKRRRRK